MPFFLLMLGSGAWIDSHDSTTRRSIILKAFLRFLYNIFLMPVKEENHERCMCVWVCVCVVNTSWQNPHATNDGFKRICIYGATCRASEQLPAIPNNNSRSQILNCSWPFVQLKNSIDENISMQFRSAHHHIELCPRANAIFRPATSKQQQQQVMLVVGMVKEKKTVLPRNQLWNIRFD